MKLLPNGNLAWSPLLGAVVRRPTRPAPTKSTRSTGHWCGRGATVGVPTDHHEMLALPNGNKLMVSYPVRTGVDITALGAGYGASEQRRRRLAPGDPPRRHRRVGVAQRGPHRAGGDDRAPRRALHRRRDPLRSRHRPHPHELRRRGPRQRQPRGVGPAPRRRVRDPSQPRPARRRHHRVEARRQRTDVAVDHRPHHRRRPVRRAPPPARRPAERRRSSHDVRQREQHGVGVTRPSTTSSTSGAGTATMVWEHRRPDGLATFGLGSTRRLADGSAIISWGGLQPLLTDIGPDRRRDPPGVTESRAGISYRSLEGAAERRSTRRCSAPTPELTG